LSLARAVGFEFIDLDEYLRRKEGKTIQQIIDSLGEAALLELEERSMREIDIKNKVIAPGGSIIYVSELMESL
jgi:shikimate kinase